MAKGNRTITWGFGKAYFCGAGGLLIGIFCFDSGFRAAENVIIGFEQEKNIV